MRYPVLLLLALSVASCGSEVISQRGSSSAGSASGGGGAATGGGAGSGQSSSGNGGSTVGACPSAPPEAGAACDVPPDGACSYGECCPLVFQCSDGVWVAVSYACPVGCPSAPPVNGSSCGPACPQNSSCTYLCGGYSPLTAECGADGSWHTSPEICPGAVPCGSDQCLSGSVCVEWNGFGPPPHCTPDPCKPEPLDCSCAETLCGKYPCESASLGHVTCLCLGCE